MRYRRPHFYPAAANGSNPRIPIFMITREDGERLIAEPGPLTLSAASTRCSLDKREAAPTSTNESSDSWEGEKSCAEWTSDESGEYLQSGNNQGFHWLYSFLTLSTRFVRDGYVRFRYAVDAEEGYDGLLFEIDGRLAWNETVSVAAPWKDFRIQVPRGSHSFTWTYKKDFGTSSGEDRARLQLLEISGTAHSDLECRSCSLLSSPGSQRCLSCGRDQYAEAGAQGVRCLHCPAGSWAPAASIGSEACRPRRACTEQDVKVEYRAAQGMCMENKTRVRARFRQPRVCSSEKTALQLAGLSQSLVSCPPCQPNRWRPDGRRCVNRPAPQCQAPLYSTAMLSITQWHNWPRNFSSFIWGRSTTEDPAHSWQRRLDGHSVVVGSEFLGREVDLQSDQALLVARVHLTSPGELIFLLRDSPPGAWQLQGGLYVNHMPRSVTSSPTADGLYQVFKTDLKAGDQEITWVWRYGLTDSQPAADAQQATGAELFNVSVSNARGAPKVCRSCPPQYGRLPGSQSCQRCPAGTEEPWLSSSFRVV